MKARTFKLSLCNHLRGCLTNYNSLYYSRSEIYQQILTLISRAIITIMTDPASLQSSTQFFFNFGQIILYFGNTIKRTEGYYSLVLSTQNWISWCIPSRTSSRIPYTSFTRDTGPTWTTSAIII